MKREWYYYLHTNGDLISKNPLVVVHDKHYFDSTFVSKVWLLDLTNRANAWKLVIEALALGANVGRVRELAIKWALTADDMRIYLTTPEHKASEPLLAYKKGLEIFKREVLSIEKITS